MDSPAPVLVVEDDPAQRELLRSLLASSRIQADLASGEEALRLATEHPREVILSDIRAGAEGLKLLELCKRAVPVAEFVVMTGVANTEKAVSALKLGAFDFLLKPLHGPDELEQVIRRAREKVKLTRDNERLAGELGRKNQELEHGVRRVELAYLSAQKAFRLGSELVGRAEPGEISEAATIGAGQVAETGRALYLELLEDGRRLSVTSWTNVPKPPPTVELAENEVDEITRDVRRGRLHPRLEPARAAMGPGPIFGAPIIVDWKLQGVLIALLPSDEDAQARATTSLRQVALAAQQAISVARALMREREVALVDPGSGLFNRRYVEQFLRREVARAQRLSLPLSAILLRLEVDGPGSDDVLRQVAGLMDAESSDHQLRFRGSDITARIGGEDVLILMPETSREGALEKARRALAGLLGHKLAGAPNGIVGRAGVAEFPRDARSPDELLVAAKAALAGAEPGMVGTAPWEGGVQAPTGIAARKLP